MKNITLLSTRLAAALLFVIMATSLTACGQKGPIEVERPPLTQDQELDDAGYDNDDEFEIDD